MKSPLSLVTLALIAVLVLVAVMAHAMHGQAVPPAPLAL